MYYLFMLKRFRPTEKIKMFNVEAPTLKEAIDQQRGMLHQALEEDYGLIWAFPHQDSYFIEHHLGPHYFDNHHEQLLDVLASKEV